MIKSMTGFGKATCELNSKKINIEIRSVNSKSLDLNMRLPHYLRDKEQDLRSLFMKEAERGKIDLSIYTEEKQATESGRINKELAKTYHKELQQLAKELKLDGKDILSLVLGMPDVISAKQQELSETEVKQIVKTIQKALELFNKHRADEGKVLEKDFSLRVNTISTLLKKIETADKKRTPAVRARIKKHLEELVDKNKIDLNRFEQELVFYMERNDITEEKVRLKTHCEYFLTTMKEAAPGRKLGFIAQEIGREINTIGSKANDADIQKLVVNMKDELEKIKEQLNNIL